MAVARGLYRRFTGHFRGVNLPVGACSNNCPATSSIVGKPWRCAAALFARRGTADFFSITIAPQWQRLVVANNKEY